MGNPFFYHQFQDDFDLLLGPTGAYALNGTGTATHTAGDGGLALITTGVAANAFQSIQLPAANFTTPGQSTVSPYPATSVKKLFYLVRLALGDITNSLFIAGLCQNGAVFAGAATSVTDGIYFSKAYGSTQLTLIAVASAGNSPTGAGVTYTLNIPTSAYNLANAAYIDLAFYIDRMQSINVFVGNPLLVGFAPQSGTGPVSTTSGVTLSPARGPAASLSQLVFNSQWTTSAPPYYWTLANLNPTLGINDAAAAAAKTLTVDFHCVQKER